MSPGQTGHITGQMGRVPGTDGTHTSGCPAKILYVYWFFFLSPKKGLLNLSGPKKTMTATDVTGFDAIFSTGFFATFSRDKLDINTGEKAKSPLESLQWRRRPEIADFCPLSWSNLS